MKRSCRHLVWLVLACVICLLPAASTQAAVKKTEGNSYILPLSSGSYRIGNEKIPGVFSYDVRSVSWKSSDPSVVKVNDNYFPNRVYTNAIFLKKGCATVTRTITLSSGRRVKTTYTFLIYKKNTWVKTGGFKYYYLTTGGFATDQWVGSRYVNADGKYDSHFKKSSDGIRYKKSDGSYAKNEWITAMDGNEYYFGSNELMAAGKWVDGCYLQNDGKKKDGLVKTDKGWQLQKNSSDSSYKKNCWDTLNGKKVYFDSDGLRVKNQWKSIGGVKYYFDSKGYLVTDRWVGEYYVGPEGSRLKNQRVGDYYVGRTGKKCTSQWINGFYVNASGKIQRNQWIDGIYVGLNGKAVNKMQIITGTEAQNGACIKCTKRQLNQLISYAKSKVGIPYLFGGDTDDGYDCCHLIAACYEDALGISIPDICYSQVGIGVEIDKDDESQWQIGDLLIRKGNPDGRGGHAMMYIGNGYVIHSHPSGGVQISSLDSVSSYQTVRRILYVE